MRDWAVEAAFGLGFLVLWVAARVLLWPRLRPDAAARTGEARLDAEVRHGGLSEDSAGVIRRVLRFLARM